MRVDDAAPFTERLVALGELFDVSLSPARQTLYFDALTDLTLEQAVQALNLAVKSCRFFPKPVELRELVIGDPDIEAEGAWLEFRAQMRRVGGYSDATFADAALANTIVAMFDSWEQACWTELSPEMWAAKRKEFGRVYAVMRARPVTGPKTLEGYCSRMNRARYGVPDPLHTLSPTGDRKLLPGVVAPAIIEQREQRELQRVYWRDNVQRAIDAAADTRASAETTL